MALKDAGSSIEPPMDINWHATAKSEKRTCATAPRSWSARVARREALKNMMMVPRVDEKTGKPGEGRRPDDENPETI